MTSPNRCRKHQSENGSARLLPSQTSRKKQGSAGASPPQRRRGSGLVIAIVTLLVITSIMGSIMHALLAELRQTRQTAIAVQAQWLAEAGVQRAVARLSKNSSYAGETWNVALPMSGNGIEPRGHVQIKLERDASSQATRVTVHATYPHDSPRSVRAERIQTIPTTKTNSSASDSQKETNE